MEYFDRYELERRIMKAVVPKQERARRGAYRGLKELLEPHVAPLDQEWFHAKINGWFGFDEVM